MPTPLPLEELVTLPITMGLTVSPDGEQVAYYDNRSGRMELCTLHLRTRERRQHTSEQAPATPRSAPVWSADSRELFLAWDHDGNERTALHVLSLDTGEVRALHHQPGSMDFPVHAHPDGTRLLVNSTRGGQMNVWQYDLTRSGEDAWTPLSTQPNSTQAVAYSPDGRRISLNTNESPDLRNLDGYVMNADGTGMCRVLHLQEGTRESVGHWHPDGTHLTAASDAAGHGRAGRLDLTSGEVQWFTPEGGPDDTPGRISPDGQWLSVTRNADSTLTPLLYSLDTAVPRALHLPLGLSSGTQYALGHQLLVGHTTTTTRADVLLYDLTTDTTSTLIPAEYGTLHPERFTPGQYIHYPSPSAHDPQVQVPAILYVPQGLNPADRHPALVHAHGGPTAQFFRTFDDEVQYLVSLGYTVICPNVRGSTGYGTPWRDANLRDWGGRDLQDIAAAATYLATLPHVDPARIGLYGVSYGGYLSYLAPVKHPDMFKVAIPIVGITDLHQLHTDNSRDIPQLAYYFRTMMGHPDEHAGLWRDRSAITHAANLKAHMLMLHGANDPRCPVNQARGFRDALNATGKHEGQDYEYVEFDDQGHGTADPAARIRTTRLIADYLARHL